MNEPVVCSSCYVQGRLPNGRVVSMNRPMEFTGQYPVQGVQTYAFHCFGCNSKAHLQYRRNRRTGETRLVQVRLTGDHDEYRPQTVSPNEQLQIPVAYTLGHTAAAQASHVPAPPIMTPEPSVQLDPRIGEGTMITADHPMHPANVRKRMQPVPVDELAQDR